MQEGQVLHISGQATPAQNGLESAHVVWLKQLVLREGQL